MTGQSPGEPGRDGTAGGITQGRLRRAAPVAGLVARTTGEAVVAGLRQRVTGRSSEPVHQRNAARYPELLGQSKGVLMKVGQMLSTGSFSAAVPAEQRAVYQGALSRLQMDAPPMAPDLAAAVLDRELGRPHAEVFDHFDPEPLAAASIGQVHAARLREDGRPVAVKVQYPGVDQAIRDDLRNTELIVTFFQVLRSFVPGLTRLDLRAMADEVAARLAEELDYRQEARNQAEFADRYRGHPFVHVPEIVPHLCTDRVLTQELIEGRRWPEPVHAPRELRDAWGEVLFRFGIGSLRRFGLFNADPHPGNYLFHDDGTVTFLDFGCVKRFDDQQVALIRAIVTAGVHGDAGAMWQALVEGGIVGDPSELTPQEMLSWWRSSLEICWAEQPFTVTPDYVARAGGQTYSPIGPSGRVVRRVQMPPDFLFLTRIDMGLLSVLGELRATSDWASIQAEYDEGAAPKTALGQADHAFWAARAGTRTQD